MSAGGFPSRASDAWPGELDSNALSVTAVEIYVDRETLDRVFVIHTTDREKIVLRVTSVLLPIILNDLSAAIRRSMH